MGVINSYRFKTAGQKRLLFDVFPFDVAINRLRSTREAWFYSTLSGAVNDVNAGTIGTNENADEASAVACVFFEDEKPVVGLLKDTTERKRITLSADMTINLGGKTLTIENDYYGLIGASGNTNKIVIDGRLSGSAVVLNGIDGGGVLFQIRTNTFTINGGSYTLNETAASNEYKSITMKTASGGTLNAFNCKIINNSVSSGHAIENNGDATISNCTIAVTSTGKNAYAIDNNANATISNCNITVTSTGKDAYGMSNAGTATISNCNIIATSTVQYSYGMSNTGTATISNCNIKAYSNYLAVNGSYVANSLGVYSEGILTINDCTVMGTHSGLSNYGVLYINGGTFEGYGHGGIYFVGDSKNAYVRNATLKNFLAMPEGYEENAGNNGAGFYCGGTNGNIYMDSCDIYGSAPSQIFVIKGSNNALYVSNSAVHNLTGGDANIRIDESNMMYLGVGNNFTAENTNRPGNVIVTNEVYVQGGGS